MITSDIEFGASVAEVYESHLVPLLFEPYAGETVKRLYSARPSRVLEIAAGTGVCTRMMSSTLPPSTSITATDLNQAMIDRAKAVGTNRPVTWRQADALELPFDDGAFDAVVCQFGAMFFPDKVRAFSEARRVLDADGVFMLTVWDRIEDNELAEIVSDAVASLFPHDPPSFLRRLPHGYYDRKLIQQQLREAGFAEPSRVVTIAARSMASSPLEAAIAYCQGTPLRNEIESRDASRLSDATHAAAEAITRQFGPGPVDARIQAHLISVWRSWQAGDARLYAPDRSIYRS